MLRAVFFDFDRTLQDIDTPYQTATAKVLGPLCQEAGVSLEAVRRSMGQHWPALWRRHLEGALPSGALRTAWLAAALPAAGIAVTAMEATGLADRYEAAFEAGLRPYDDVLPALEVLRSARPDLPLGLLTNGPGDTQRRRLEALGLARWFSVLVISGEVGCSKPAPALFTHALQRVACALDEAVMVGDDPHTDVGGAVAAGLRAIWLNRDGRPWPAQAGPAPTHAVRSLLEAVALLERW